MLMIGASICRIAWMGAKLHVDIRAVPAAVHTLGLCEDTLGTYHHQVADGQRAVNVIAIARTDGSVSSIT